MDKKKQVLISVAVSVILALLIGMYLTGLENKYKIGAKKVTVLVARDYIDQGSMINENMVEQVKIPQDYIQPKTLREYKDLNSETGIPLYMASAPILKGEQIMTTKVFGLGQETGLAAVIPTDKRAYSVSFEKQKVKGIIRPGNKIDIISVMDFYDDKGRKVEESRTILQNVSVISVGKQIFGVTKPEKAGKAGEQNFNEEDGDSNILVSFAVTPEESQLLALVTNKGSISFALRPTGDEKVNEIYPAKMSKIFGAETSAAKMPQIGSSTLGMMKDFKKQQTEALKMLEKYGK